MGVEITQRRQKNRGEYMAIKPLAPILCNLENQLPAATSPILAWRNAANEPNTIPK